MYEKIKDILKNKTILIADSDTDMLDSLQKAISSYASSTIVCSNGKNALKAYKQNKTDLIISEINLPILSGIELAASVRSMDSEVPILFITSFASDEDVELALSLGCAGMLKKPFDKRELIMTMSFVLNKFKQDFANISLGRGYEFNSLNRQLSLNKKPITLTKKEQLLLHLLLKNQARVVSFEMIEAFVWAGESCTPEAIRSFVYKLRKKLYPELITNAQGSGYQLCLSPDTNSRTAINIKYI